MPAPQVKVAGRGKIAHRVQWKQLFALKVPKHEWVLIPIYEFARNALSAGAIVGITGLVDNNAWFELGFVRSGDYNSEMREMVYRVALVSRANTVSSRELREIKINASRIGCIFNNDKSRLPVTTG